MTLIQKTIYEPPPKSLFEEKNALYKACNRGKKPKLEFSEWTHLSTFSILYCLA